MAQSSKKNQNKLDNIMNQATVYISAAKYCRLMNCRPPIFLIHILIEKIRESCSNTKNIRLKQGRRKPVLKRDSVIILFSLQYSQYNLRHITGVVITKMPIILRIIQQKIVIARLYHSVGG